METPEIIDGLKDLIKDRNSFIDQNEPDNIFEHDKEVLKAAIDALSAAPKNKSLTVFSAITESPESLAKFLERIEDSKLQLNKYFCKSNCGNDGCPHELQCITNWLNQPAHKAEKAIQHHHHLKANEIPLITSINNIPPKSDPHL
ncbi:protein of unknown function [Ruminococcaceae bacterium BL-4]|jgi:hypothetical protein|nr:protein of unknown function [Ruminococcaceae bacterium BL-4]